MLASSSRRRSVKEPVLEPQALAENQLSLNLRNMILLITFLIVQIAIRKLNYRLLHLYRV